MFGKHLLTKARPTLCSGKSLTHRWFIFGGRNERVTFAMSKLARSLKKAGIDYCIVGGNALHAHGFERATTDVDILMTSEGLEKFAETHVGRGYAPRFVGAKTKFRNTMDDVPIEILLTGAYPRGNQTSVPFPHPNEISYEESYLGWAMKLFVWWT